MNRRLQLTRAGFLFALLGLACPVIAWNIPAHMVHGAMTYQILRQENSRAIEAVNLLLRHHPWQQTRWRNQLEELPDADRDEMLFMLAARWADDIRTRDRALHRGQWHYINFPFKPAGEPASIQVTAAGAEHFNRDSREQTRAPRFGRTGEQGHRPCMAVSSRRRHSPAASYNATVQSRIPGR